MTHISDRIAGLVRLLAANEAWPFDGGGADVSARVPSLDDFRPHASKTDDYESRKVFTPDFRDISMTDVIPEHDDLAMAGDGQCGLGEALQSAPDATLEVMDATGDAVRTLTPAGQMGEEGDRWAGQALLFSGPNWSRWELRTDPGSGGCGDGGGDRDWWGEGGFDSTFVVDRYDKRRVLTARKND